MGRTKDEQLHIIFQDFPLHIGKINGILSVLINQGTFHHFPFILADHIVERIIHGRLDQHRITGPGGRPNRRRQGKHHTGGLDQPFLPDLPAKMGIKPADDGIIISLSRHGIAEDAVLHSLVQRIQHTGRCLEVHIRHPKGQNIGAVALGLCRIKLDTVGTPAVNDPVKIVTRHTVPSRIIL